ncbi:MAG: glutamate ligase domain-containing protein, partial [Bradyrhizobium sp.]
IHDSHVGFDGIRGPEDLARIKSIVARYARRTLLLNADDALCLAMRQVAGRARLCLVGKEARSPVLREHLAGGGDAVSLRPTPDSEEIVIVERGVVRSVVTTAEIPATLAGRHGGKVWNAMFAAGIAHAMGASLEHIRDGLRSFRPDIGDAQGRLSIIHRSSCPVILDHAGRPIAGRELAAAIRKMPIAGRKLVLITASRDGGLETVKDMGRALAGAFDTYVCTNRSELKPTDLHTMPGLLRDGIVESGVAAADVHCILSEEEAVRYVLGNAGRDDLVVMISFKPEVHAALIESFDASRGVA